jgi:LuxR family transcriptional regulator, activator of tox operons
VEQQVQTTTFSNAVMALGEADFDAALLTSVRGACPTDLCSAFVARRPEELAYLLSNGGSDDRNALAYDVSHQYAAHFWRRDLTTQSALASSSGSSEAHIRRLRCDRIDDREYRELHARHGVIDRLSVYRFLPDSTGFILNLYRAEESGWFSTDEVDAVEAMADMLSTLVVKHCQLTRNPASLERHPPIAEMARCFMESDARLSPREAEICAMYMTGQVDKEVARATGLQLNSIITYRKRAYQKLGVSDRRGLARYYDECLHRA